MKREFQDKDARAACDSRVVHPYGIGMPVLTGGISRWPLEPIDSTYVIPSLRRDMALVPIPRTVGQNRADAWCPPQDGPWRLGLAPASAPVPNTTPGGAK